MTLNETAFLKACKRLAQEDSTPLSTGQEKLSRVFGFKNFDAAQKALKKGQDRAPSAHLAPSTVLGRTWRGLDAHETGQFLQSMHDIAAFQPSDPWIIRSRQLSLILVEEFFSRDGGQEVQIAELMKAGELEQILARCCELEGKRHLLASQKRFLSFISHIPEYKESAKRGASVFAEQWSYLHSAHEMALISMEVADSITETGPVWARLKTLCLNRTRTEAQIEEIAATMRRVEQLLLDRAKSPH